MRAQKVQKLHRIRTTCSITVSILPSTIFQRGDLGITLVYVDGAQLYVNTYYTAEIKSTLLNKTVHIHKRIASECSKDRIFC